MVLDLEVLAQFLHHLVIQIGGIVCDNILGQSIPADYFLFNEFDYHDSRDTGVQGGFNPFGELVDRNQDEVMPVRSLGLNGPDHIYSPHGEGPRCCQNVQRHGRSIDIVRECPALMAFPNMDATIALHEEPVISRP